MSDGRLERANKQVLEKERVLKYLHKKRGKLYRHIYFQALKEKVCSAIFFSSKRLIEMSVPYTVLGCLPLHFSRQAYRLEVALEIDRSDSVSLCDLQTH
jgi:hypothetical protein